MILAPLRWLARRTRLVLPLGIFLGLAAPPLAELLRPLLSPSVVLLLVAGMMRVDWPGLRRAATWPLAAGLGPLWLLAGMPALVALLTLPLGLPEDLRRILVLIAAMPPILSGPALAGLMGLDATAALVVLVASTLLVPLSLPTVATLLAGAGDLADPVALFLRMGGIVAGAVLLALLLRALLGPERLARRKDEIDGFGVLVLLVFAVGVMDGVPERLAERPGLVLLYTLAAFGINLGMQALAALAFLRSGARSATTLAFLSGNRNAALLLAVLPPEPALTLYIAVAQFPIYLLPSLLFPLYRRLAGAAPGVPAP
jgi:BASS family bile acid:Na+ symporter